MKKRFLKTLSRKALAVAIGAALMVQAYVPTIASAAWSMAGIIYKILTGIKYEDDTLADVVINEKSKYSFDSVEERMVLYPILDAMSKGQQSVLEYVDLGELIISGNIDEKRLERYQRKI